jgi:phage tail sheath protein FI
MTISQFAIPGVYRQDIFPKPLPALPTGVPVFLGFTEHELSEEEPKPGASYRLHKLTHWPQFMERFASYQPSEYLARAVHGFFANGGFLCYILMLWVPKPTTNLDEILRQGLEVADSITDVDLVCAPDLVRDSPSFSKLQGWQQIILDHCDRTNDRFAILDAPLVTSTDGLAQILQHRQALKGNNGALYGPWLKPEQGDWLPPCGHVAGIYARCDRTTGVHRAPANLVMEDVLDLSLGLTDAEQLRLNPIAENAGVNCLRALPGRGIRIWGARTLSQEANHCNVNVRRLFITVGRWATLNLANLAFEPNDFNLWVRIERELRVYLESLARQGALQGSTAEEAFFIKCDAQTNPPEVREQGQVITEIGLAPTIPSEFIVLRLIHGDTGVSLTSAT